MSQATSLGRKVNTYCCLYVFSKAGPVAAAIIVHLPNSFQLQVFLLTLAICYEGEFLPVNVQCVYSS